MSSGMTTPREYMGRRSAMWLSMPEAAVATGASVLPTNPRVPSASACGSAATPVIVRRATEQDQAAIRTLVRSERLNPTDLDWQNFVVAADAGGLQGAAQIRKHPEGARELGSLVVAERLRGNGIAARLIDTLLAEERGPVHMITGLEHAAHYQRWGFRQIDPSRTPRPVRFNYYAGRMARVISFFKRCPPRQLVILERQGAGAPPELIAAT
jgi:amino-acid N-acetyltransferase